ncbi:CDP-glycerol glycerophosphotransferase family protein [Paenibacillus taichungensis]|uniref:bifunctional glycosyltransferase/CDP-glycerol:glycerophosphate glycerophosphotransferase n=1 Tax=Paenibacillus taichungensis TaxID=484184 RepID=UPI002DB94886|nr:CDP-glycerol glycerophosphotransferase family protein [Paenibacillus taichungensis]MEC0106175.1 CDP-glycerol glycerophosphotransferase family protein [Paenibacillus taichungensis]MEC0199404.1 CDP-glycerol glycerophosphotransferase family protein [Paenibacillus taichungensis]
MENVKVSVIVPVYNAQYFLKECVDSLLNQTLNCIEIILVNDGSTDSSQNIINYYSDKYPDLIKAISKKNSGPSKTRNAGLEQAKGDYVVFIDADDFVDSRYLEKMYLKAIEHESDLVVCGYYNVFLINGKKRMQKTLPNTNIYEKNIFEEPKLLSGTSLFVWDKLFKKSIIDEKGIKFPEDLDYGEDFAFLSKYKYFSRKISCVREGLYYYRVKGKNSITGSYNDSVLDLIKSLELVCDFYLDKGIFNTFQRELYVISAGYYVRRLNDFSNYNNKKLQKDLVDCFYEYMNNYFHGWEKKIKKFRNKNIFSTALSLHRGKKALTYAYIWTPNIIKKSVNFGMRSIGRSKNQVKKSYKKVSAFKQKINFDRILYAYFRKYFKVSENKIFMISYFGSSITDSVFYMLEKIQYNNQFSVYVGSNNLNRDSLFLKYNKLNVIMVKIHSVRYLFLLATAKHLIINSRFPDYFSKRDEQNYLNTWHGTPLKTLGKKMVTGIRDLGNNQSNFLMADYLLFPNRYTKDHMMRDYFLEDTFTGKVILTGYPRNDIFFNTEAQKSLKDKLGIEGKKVYVYMPTWRGSTINSLTIKKYQDEVEALLDKLDKSMSGDKILFVKLHQLVMRKIKINKYDNIKPFHPQYETYEFLNMADCLITDYSSVFFDFANTKKEIILFMYDYEEYLRERGLYLNINELPFTKIYNLNDLVDHINTDIRFTPSAQYYEFLKEYCTYDSPNNTEKLINAFILQDECTDLTVTSYKKNKENEYEIVIMNNLLDEKDINEFSKLLSLSNQYSHKIYFAFDKNSMKDETSKILYDMQSDKLNYIIMQGSMPFTIGEFLVIFCFRKFRIFRSIAKKIYKVELQRLFPNMDIKKIKNYSENNKYKDLVALFNEE